MVDTYKIAFGDIHNHNAHGYGQGSIERSLDIARTHLDFFAFTGHGCWHDLNAERDPRLAHFTKGFEQLKRTWPRVQKAIASANTPGEFAAFLGYEWHSNFYGDQCVIFPDDGAGDGHQMCHADTLEELRAFCRDSGAMLLPHHVAYPKGVRGLNWDYYDPTLAPVVELHSMHGCSETDRSPFPMHMGSPGGRSTEQTIAAALARGARFGFTASTDSHNGFPGAWGQGVTAALVKDVSREAVWEALHARRCYALTGDRIFLDFTVNGALMGQEITAEGELHVAYDVDCRDEIRCVELIVNNEVVHSATPTQAAEDDLYQLRLEWGWGPWGSLDTPKTVDWAFALTAQNARIERMFPCLTSGPFDEDRRHRFETSETSVTARSYTSRKDAFNGHANQAVVVEFKGDASTQFGLSLTEPVPMSKSYDFADLCQRSFEFHTGDYPSESMQLHRMVPASLSTLRNEVTLPVPEGPGFAYLRVTQKNGQMAWSSPVFVNPPSP